MQYKIGGQNLYLLVAAYRKHIGLLTKVMTVPRAMPEELLFSTIGGSLRSLPHILCPPSTSLACSHDQAHCERSS